MTDYGVDAAGVTMDARGRLRLRDKVLAQILVQGAGTAFNAAGGLLVLLVLGRVLGPERFGEYVVVLSAAVVVLTVLEGGWPTRVYRDTTDAAADAVSATSLVRCAFGYLATAACVIALLLMPFALRQPAWLAALACMTLVAAMNLVSARMRAAGRFALEAGWQVAGRIASGALIICGAIWLSPASAGVFVYWSLGLLLMLVVGHRWLAAPGWHGLRAALPLTAPFLVIDALAALLRSDAAIAAWAGASGEPLSFYAACTRMNEAALLLFAPVGNVLLRSLRLQAGDPSQFARLWRSGVLAAALAGAAAVIGSVLLGQPLMSLLFGERFAPAGLLLPYTAAMLPFALGNLVMIQAIVARGGERRLALLLAPAAIAMVAALMLGWRAGGLYGAALALVAAHAMVWLAALGWLLRTAHAGTGTAGRTTQ